MTAVPTSLGPYRLLRLLGEGGMGSVWLGRDPSGTLVAIKVIKAEHARDPGFRARFRSEVNRARAVPAFCTAEVLDADPDHETPYLVVEYVDGPSLQEVIRDQGPLRGGNLHSVAVGVASALVAIHSAGIVHRDLKPANVLFALGSPKVIDFGIAKALEATSHHTRPQEMVGTLSYMAPERLNPDTDQNLTPAADIFAWGAIVGFAATGRNPFAADNPLAIAGRILTQPPNLDGLPPTLAGIVERALAKDPAQRPTARELLLELTAGPSSEDSTVRLRGATSRLRGPASQLRDPASRLRGATSRLRGAASSATRWRVAGAAAITAVLLTAGGAVAGTLLSRSAGTPVSAPSPGPFPSSAAAAPPSAAAVKNLADPLTSPGLWTAYEDVDGGCTINKGLVVWTESFFRCDAGPEQNFAGDMTIEVRAKMTADTCAIIFFRLSADAEDGYYTMICEDYVGVLFLYDGLLTGSAYVNVDEGTLKRLRLAGTGLHRFRMDVTGAKAVVTVDGKKKLTADLVLEGEKRPRSTSGRVALGATGPLRDPAGEVTFRDFRLTTP
ncbi:serine/threonine-protein kinase [Actinoplanes couchii]|uniref:Protein kinase domain-containing protein n=1 Tax=Actinoplanes couchii TaxID=403638 RepID=A0ABQ3XFH9_9ACTN|nr:serine/threonine-protein kinase [Actinoplanes couchii]MDR6321782.1 putative Ser/Thr protein kinase [Actinoplanes couchii]GID57260.1 hypothetical protein Aco03nite_056640 [Actinoplanes couchii]